MRYDGVERDLFVLSVELTRAVASIRSLVSELRRERGAGSLSITREREPTPQELSEIKSDGAQPWLFPEELNEVFETDASAQPGAEAE